MINEVGPAPINKATDKEVWVSEYKPLTPEFIAQVIEIDNVYAKQIWNAAIEAAANKIEVLNCNYEQYIIEADEIRKLKK